MIINMELFDNGDQKAYKDTLVLYCILLKTTNSLLIQSNLAKNIKQIEKLNKINITLNESSTIILQNQVQ